MYSEEKIKTLFKDDNAHQLNTLITEGKIDASYQSSRKRNLIQMACLYSSEQCLKVLLNHYGADIIDVSLLGFFISHGAKNTQSQKCLLTLLSASPNILETNLVIANPVYSFLHNGYTDHFKIALPFYHSFDKNYKTLFKESVRHYKYYAERNSSSESEKDERLLMVKYCLFHIHHAGLFLPIKMINEHKDITPSLTEVLKEYEILVEQQMLELFLQPTENKDNQNFKKINPISKKKKHKI